ncbi:EF-Tu/IF-2/RF-3 family GTPase [Microbacterium sp. PMB16]
MGWFSRKKNDPQDANELLRRYNEAEAARISGLTSGSTISTAAPTFVSAGGASAELAVEDVFTITGRGQVAIGTVTIGTIRVDDDVAVLRDGAQISRTAITGIEMFRKRANEASAGAMVGVLLRDRIDVSRGDVIRVTTSA